jgi:phosphohistidine phosphatase
MQVLYIVRHGIAVPHGTPDIPEDERPLTPKGEKRVQQIGRGLRRLGVEPGRIVSSPLPRALRTAELLAEALAHGDKPTQEDALRAGRPAVHIRDWLGGQHDERLMIVGHDPAFSQLVGLLTAGDQAAGPVCELAKGGVAALVADPSGRFLLDWLATPRLLRKLS